MSYSKPRTFVYVYIKAVAGTKKGDKALKAGYSIIQEIAWCLNGHWKTESVLNKIRKSRPDLIGLECQIQRGYYYTHKPSYYGFIKEKTTI